MTANLKKLWKNEYVQTAVVIGLIVLIVLVFWFGAQVVLNASTPMLVVVSGSMCINKKIKIKFFFLLEY